MSDDFGNMTVTELLRVRISVDAELVRRGISRTSGPIIGELAERLAVDVYGGELAAPGRAAVDLIAGDGRRVQVKARALPRGDHRFFSFKSLDFDLALCIRFDRATYDIDWARQFTSEDVRRLASRQKTDWRLRTGVASTAGVDVTPSLRSALVALNN
jgi:hypothetical protein